MGAGACAGVTSGLTACSDEDLKTMCKAMPSAERAKLMEAIAGGKGAAAAPAAEAPAAEAPAAEAPAAEAAAPAAAPASVAPPAGAAPPAAEAAAPAAATANRRYALGANWKCNPEKLETVKELCTAFKAAKFDTSKVEVILCVTNVHSATVIAELAGTGIEVGCQNISKTALGAFTGEIPAAVAVDVGFTWCLIGHSERRSLYGETIEDTADKLKQAQEAGLKVMFCIGEQLAEREAGETDAVNKKQLDPILGLVSDWDKFVIAYEPVWAIGTGKVATPEQAQETQASIRSFVNEKCGAEIAAKVRIQYGGSASPDNIEGLAKNPDIDGFLVGGASLKPTFTKMMEHLNTC